MHIFHYGIQETQITSDLIRVLFLNMQTPIWAPNAEKHGLMFILGASNFNLIYFTHLKGQEPPVSRYCYEVLIIYMYHTSKT